jgi:selenocysteine lyase/cysteine desulfurase
VASSITSSSKQPLDVTAVRERFPALATRAAFLDGPGGSQVPQEVLDAVAAYLRGSNANLGGAFPTSAASDEIIADARAAAADFTGATPEGIAFGANMTTLNFQLAHAVARTLEPGDEIIVTQLDHDANVSPWLLVARDHGLVVRTAPIHTDDVTLDENARGRLHPGLERCGLDPRRRANRLGGAQGRGAGLGGRRAPRPAPAPPRA